MADETPDPEVEWLAARLLADHMAGDATEPWAALPEYIRETWRAPARTALTILRERYILVPREGTDPTPWEPGTEATAGQWLWRILTVTPDVRSRVIESTLHDARRGHSCFLFDHESMRHALDLAHRRLAEVTSTTPHPGVAP